MKNLFIEPTTKTPKIDFNYETGVLKIEGRMIPENSIEFCEPILKWLESYLDTPKETTVVSLRMEYYNTSGHIFFWVFKPINELVKRGNKVFVKWYYEEDDEDMLEAGKDMGSMNKIPFEFIKIEEEH